MIVFSSEKESTAGTPAAAPAGNIQMVGKSNAEAMRGEQPEKTWFAPEWTLTDTARHSVDWWLTTEDLPVPENRVTTDKDGNVHLTYTPDQRRGGRPAVRRS